MMEHDFCSAAWAPDTFGSPSTAPTVAAIPGRWHHLKLMDVEAAGNGHASGKATSLSPRQLLWSSPQNAFTDALKSSQLASEAGSIMLLSAWIAEAID